MATLQHATVPPAADGDVASRPPRARILAAARELFYRNGLNAVGVEAIADLALTNKMTLYRHFKSKDDLIVAYVSQLASDGEAVWERIEREFPDTPQKRLDAWVEHVDDVLTNRSVRGCALANAAVELQAGHAARTVIEAYKVRKRDRLVTLFAAARYQDPERLADEVFLLLEGARISMQCGGKGPASRVTSMLRDVLAKSSKRRRNK